MNIFGLAAVILGVVVMLIGFEVITVGVLSAFIWSGIGIICAGLANLGSFWR